MITKEEIIEILTNHSGYIDRSMSDKALHECNFSDVADKILSRLHLDAVSICACGSNDYYAEVYKDVTKYYCKKCHEKISKHCH